MKRPTPTRPIDAIVLTRLDALERLIDSEYGGSPSFFQEKTGIKMSQVNQWFTGYRALRDKALKNLALKTNKDLFYFETPVKSLEERSLELKVAQLANMLSAIPADARERAYFAAVEALISHLPVSSQHPIKQPPPLAQASR